MVRRGFYQHKHIDHTLYTALYTQKLLHIGWYDGVFYQHKRHHHLTSINRQHLPISAPADPQHRIRRAVKKTVINNVIIIIKNMTAVIWSSPSVLCTKSLYGCYIKHHGTTTIFVFATMIAPPSHTRRPSKQLQNKILDNAYPTRETLYQETESPNTEFNPQPRNPKPSKNPIFSKIGDPSTVP